MSSGRLSSLLGTLMLAGTVLLPGPASGEENVDQLMGKLADPDFKTRKETQQQLVQWGKDNIDAAIERFYRAYEGNEDPEIRSRSRHILRELVIFKQAGEGKGYLGIRMQADELMGADGTLRPVVRITDVMDGTPAKKAGLLPNDLIVGINDFVVEEGDALDSFGKYVQNCKPRTDVTLRILRGGKPMDVVVNLMRRPPDLEQQTFFWGGQEYRPPSQEDLEEKEFQEWLRDRRRQDAEAR